MQYGDLFKKITKKDILNIFEINKIIKTPKYKKYGNNLVNKRGSIFRNRNIDINKKFDELINGY